MLDSIQELLITQKEDYIKFGIVPWDTEIFEFNVVQVLDYNISDINNVAVLNKKLTDKCNELDTKNICWKINEVDNKNLVNAVLKEGFEYIEMTINPHLNLNSFNGYDKFVVHLDQAEKKDLDEMKNIAISTFKNDRFHIDSKFPEDKANYRFSFWIQNSYDDNDLIYVLKKDNKVIGFFISKVKENNKLELSLAGISEEHKNSKYGIQLYASMLEHFKKENYKKAYSTISMNNLSVFRLYAYFGFIFNNPKLILHKWL